jgi:mRNA interferase MazF
MRPTVIYEPFTVVTVPFPFGDREATKRRPALVLSRRQDQSETGHITLMMITNAAQNRWSNDHKIKHLTQCGLNKSSIIRQKIFTVASTLVIRKIGSLHAADKKEMIKLISAHLALSLE